MVGKIIVADDLFQVLRNDYNINGANLAMVKRHIDAAPAVDAVEVVHAKWINKTKEIHGMVDERNDCSNCGQVYWFACPDFNYCPNCGAKMTGDENGKEK